MRVQTSLCGLRKRNARPHLGARTGARGDW